MSFKTRNGRRQTWLVRSSITALSLAYCTTAALADESADASGGNDIVVTAAGFEQKITDAPASISVISAEELEGRPYVTLLDAVRYLEGVDIGETRDKTGQGTISLRGMGSDYTLILINGRRQNNNGDIYPNSFGGNQFNHIPPRDSIERIEVIRGPASTLYGADAMGGVINIITKRNLDRWNGSMTVSRTFEGSKEYGNDTTADAYVNGPLIKGLLNLTARGSWYKRDASNPSYTSITDPNGLPIDRSLGFGGGGKTVDNENWSGGVSLTLTPTDNQTITFDYDISRQKYDNAIKINDDGVEEYPVGTVDNYGAMLRVGSNGRIEPRAGYAPTQEFSRDSWSVTHQGNWSFGNSRVTLSHVSTNNDGRTLPFSVTERQSLQGLWNTACVNMGGSVTTATGYCRIQSVPGYANQNVWNNLSEAQKLAIFQNNLTPQQYQALQGYLPRPKRTLESEQYTLDAQMDMPFNWGGQHNLVVGGQLIRGKLNDSVFGLETNDAGRSQKHNMWSLFIEDTYRPIEAFAITAGVRYDDHEVFGSHVSPRLYGVYNISSQFTLKGGVSTGFKTPKTTQLYDGVVGFGSQGTSPMYGNPNLKPETTVSTEVALYWQHPDGHGFNVTAFHNSFDDKIANQPCGPNEVQECASPGAYEEIGYSPSSTRATNIDRVVIQGIEISARAALTKDLRLRANYTLTDSEQKSGAQQGLPLGESARHMANASLDWKATDKLSFLLSGQYQSKRYRSVHPVTGEALTYRPYHIVNLGAAYEATKQITLNVRVNNLLNKDYTSYRTEFRDLNGDGLYDGTNETLFYDNYNNKDKGRSLWVSMNARF
ncbi:TonB-dependent receptor domain-containing protein [Sphingopyxis yananensis]|uniref:TonB-dependent receptor domain-containing protein n=1 Tax=Sphingopyxis yananensis TaxID=2886687 RepID=UPI001D122C23|nr:TonB-dependent receptor [Sphingopyxis yananensis]MCC2603236.1 TonB-dependent receptor [Sphingopyxis yananensis]